MLNGIILKVSEYVKVLFPESVVYIGEIESGFSKPCFLISFSKSSEKPMVGNRALREIDITITYYREGVLGITNGQIVDVLMDGLESLKLEDDLLLRGTQKSSRIENGVLIFSIHYSLLVTRLQEQPGQMNTLTLNTTLKEEKQNVF